jgi:lipid II:glycine glycyltransferase (peptidoglycan interpeptide bridge formation enzyme)
MWQRITDAHTWDEALRQLPWPHVLQSRAWGDFKSRWGWRAERWLLADSGNHPRAAVQLLKRTINRLPACVLYAPKGPVAIDLTSYEAALSHIEQRARHHRALWAKVDGDLFTLSSWGRGQGKWPSEGPEGTDLSQLRSLLVKRHWRYSASQIQFRNTGLSDVRHSDADLLAAMKPKTRYNVRLAEKRGVTVRVAAPIGDADAHLLYAMYAATAQRDGFLIRDEAYYLDAWRAMSALGLIAEREGQALAGLVMFIFGGRAWYFYGMSRNEGREHMPSYALQWHALRWARDHGCEAYDWWGAPEREDDDNDGMAGVWRFKQGFGATFSEGIGAWDYAPSPLLYRAYLEFGSRFIRSGLAG